MSLFSRAFNGIPATFSSSLDRSAATASLMELKRWKPGKPLLTGEIGPDRIELAFVPYSGYGRAPTRFEGLLESSEIGCVLRGRFVSPASVRAATGLGVAVAGLMAFGGLAAGLRIFLSEGDSLIGPHLLALAGWLLVVGLFGCVALWNATPSRAQVRDMTKHLEAALRASGSAST
jgi:hypothetical protein